jgi:hypothetical protein
MPGSVIVDTGRKRRIVTKTPQEAKSGCGYAVLIALRATHRTWVTAVAVTHIPMRLYSYKRFLIS